ncbi:major facilitator superfamily domain-containing protein [Phycomyces nitens]|nr:major facilitator superfamily domain-containing protein [Phycomyces nitens]
MTNHDSSTLVNESTSLLGSERGLKDSPKAESWSDLKPYVRPLVSANIITVMAGLSDGTFGVMIPRLKEHYDISNSTVSLLFLFNAAGFFISGFLNGFIVKKIGQRATIYMASISLMIVYLLALTGQRFEIMLGLMLFQGGSISFLDAAVNVYTANVPMATLMLNILHANYGVGAMISPLVGTAFLVRNITWRAVYGFLAGAAFLNIISVIIGFGGANIEQPNEHEIEDEDSDELPKPRIATPNHPIRNTVTILSAGYILIYVGVEVIMGAWGYTFLTEGRHGDKEMMGHVTAGYWGGLAIGRLVLGYLAGRLGEKRTITALTVTGGVVLIIFGLVESVVVDSIALVAIGFLIGPMFPTTISLVSQLLPRHIHATSIGFISAIGASGAAILPYGAGLIADQYGILSIPLACFVMLVIMQLMWTFVPNPRTINI